MAEVSLILGGQRSGKTRRALGLCATPPHCYIATAEPLDAEMSERIARHKAERGPDWELREAPLDLCGAVLSTAAPGKALLIDCLTLWLGNVIHHGYDPEHETGALARTLRQAPGRIVVVSNELGLGVVPMGRETRAFVDAHGLMNQRIADIAGHVELIVAGQALLVKGSERRAGLRRWVEGLPGYGSDPA